MGRGCSQSARSGVLTSSARITCSSALGRLGGQGFLPHGGFTSFSGVLSSLGTLLFLLGTEVSCTSVTSPLSFLSVLGTTALPQIPRNRRRTLLCGSPGALAVCTSSWCERRFLEMWRVPRLTQPFPGRRAGRSLPSDGLLRWICLPRLHSRHKTCTGR